MVLHPMVLAGVALIAGATLAGAWLSARTRRLPSAALRITAALLLAVVLADLMPDILRDLPGSGLPWWGAAVTAAAGFAMAGLVARFGCACAPGPPAPESPAPQGRSSAGGPAWPPGPAMAGTGAGWGAAAALAVHRALEGAAVTLSGSAAVIAVLVVHAAAEGFALAALLRAGRRRLLPLLIVACLSPAAGALVLTSVPVPAGVSVLLTCVVAGVLARTALTAWRAARPGSAGESASGSPAERRRGDLTSTSPRATASTPPRATASTPPRATASTPPRATASTPPPRIPSSAHEPLQAHAPQRHRVPAGH